MIVRTFTKKEHEDYGHVGLCANWMANAEPGNGQLCAHDMLEHFASDPGPAEGEFMALGASVFIRGLNGWFAYERPSSPRSMPAMYAGDFSSILERVADGTESLDSPGTTRKLAEETDEDVLQEIVSLGFLEARNELRHHYGDGATIDAEEYPDVEAVLSAENQRRALGWLRKGFRKAERRYAGVDSYSLSRLFSSLAKKIDKAAADAEMGDEIVARVDIHNMSAYAEVKRPSYSDSGYWD